MQHVAFIMDGNRRWAKQRGLSASEGHTEGSKRAETVVEWCVKHNIPHVTLWALSTENWKKRSETELTTIFKLLAGLPKQMAKLKEHGVSIDIIGNRDAMPLQMRAVVDTVERSLAVPDAKFKVHIALNYGGRDELCQAVRSMHRAGIDAPTADDVASHLYTAGIPDVDWIIRTGGEKRLSGFMLWQCEYAELSFVDTYWPALDHELLDGLLEDYAHRQRNFGA